MKTLSKKDEKLRRSMSDFKLGDFVGDMDNGCYGWIRGFKDPWIWLIEPYADGADIVAYDLISNFEKYQTCYEVHFTNLTKVDAVRARKGYQEALIEVSRWEKFAQVAGITLT